MAETTKVDVFAQIAAQARQQRDALLIEPQPPAIRRKKLESRKSSLHAAFSPPAKLDTPEKLQRELQRLRRQTDRFTRDLAPKLKPTRKTIALDSFDFRHETQADRADFAHTLAGRGKWQRVAIPHFGGPTGRAAAYYRTTFDLAKSDLARSKACWLCFKGADYKTHAFLNGTYVGSHEGFFAPFEFDLTAAARPGRNVLVVRIENDAICMSNDSWGDDKTQGDKIYAATGLGWDDPEIGWHHCPPGMGIYQDACVQVRANYHVADLFVRPLIDRNQAELWIDLYSTQADDTELVLEYAIHGQNFKQTVLKSDKQQIPVGPTLNYYRYRVDMPDPRIWDLESPWLYQLQVKLYDQSGRLLDAAARQFGLRDFRLDTSTEPKGRFLLNRRPVKLRGANTMGHMQQCVAKKDWNQLRDDILLAKLCNMNFFRLTQRPVQPEIYEFCDRLGMMTQTDLPLFGVLRRNQFAETVRQAGEMERLVRAHPCNVAVSYINEPFSGALGRAHRHLQRDELEAFFQAADRAVLLENPDCVIKHVDGDYDPPDVGLPDNHCYNCWYNLHGLPLGKLIKGYWQKVKPGWNYACGEFGAEGLDHVNTMLEGYPKTWLPKKLDEPWSPASIVQAQTARFHYVWFTTQRTLPEWVAASQRFQGWATATMTEAFRRDPRMISFAIHLFIDAFPSGWMKAIMDVKRQPKPAYFAYRDALAPVAANIRSDRTHYFANDRLDAEFWVCNDLPHELKGHRIAWQLRQGRKTVFAAQTQADVPALAPSCQGVFDFRLPDVAERTAFTLQLALKDRAGKIVHWTQRSFDVFPKLAPSSRKVYVLARQGGAAWKLALQLGLKPQLWNNQTDAPILVDSPAELRRHKSALNQAVRQGGRVVLTDLEMTEKDWNSTLTFANAKFTLQHPGMGPRYFANCSTSHPLVHGFQQDDFFLWHSTATDMIEPLMPVTMQAEGLQTILATGEGDWAAKTWNPAPAAALSHHGQGQFIVSLIALLDRVTTNPPAKRYALRLLNLT